MDPVRRGRGRPRGLVFTTENEQRMMERIRLFADRSVPLSVKENLLSGEQRQDRLLRNYLLAGKQRLCSFCTCIRPGVSPQSWTNHMFTGKHLSREFDELNCTSRLCF
jgi:hypothetical protein